MKCRVFLIGVPRMPKSPVRPGPWSLRALVVASAVALSSCCLASGTARAAGVSWTNYSVVTIGSNGNPSAGGLSTSSDITGNAFVSGSVTGGSFTIGQDLPTVSNPSAHPQYALTVAGSLNFNNYMNVNDGYSVQYAGSLGSNAHFNFNGGGILTTIRPAPWRPPSRACTARSRPSRRTFSKMATTGTVSVVGGNTLTFDYTGKSGGVAVFDVNATTLNSGSVQDLNLLLNGGLFRGHQRHGPAVVELQPDECLCAPGKGRSATRRRRRSSGTSGHWAGRC